MFKKKRSGENEDHGVGPFSTDMALPVGNIMHLI